METKLFNRRTVSVSEIVPQIHKSPFNTNVSHQISFCKGNSQKAYSYSRISNGRYESKQALSSDEKECLLYGINGTSGSIAGLWRKEIGVLDSVGDEYGGVLVDAEKLPSDPNLFARIIRSSLSHWKIKGKQGVWLKLPVEKSELVPVAVKAGFEYHHAEQGYVMMTYWIPEGPSLLPNNASHQVGIGGFVINEQNEVLVVQEKHCEPAFSGLWKIPTGFILASEEIFTGAVREVQEETGIDTEFIEVIAFRHVHNVAFEKSDLFFICMLRPLSREIVIDDLEIQAAKWMPLIDFVEQPLIQEDSMFKKVIDICIARLGKRYCGLASHQLVSKFDGKPSTLYYNVLESQGSTCLGD